LETAEDILIKSITKLKYRDDTIYIFDKNTQTIFSFTKEGKLIWKIQNRGYGPGEYTQLTDFDIDKKANKLYLLCFREKIQEYDLSGNFVKEYNVRLGGISLSVDGDYMYIYAGNNPNAVNNTTNGNYHLIIYNKNEDTLQGIMAYEYNSGSTKTYNSSNAFYYFDNETRFFMPYSYAIYSIKGDSMKIAYSFDFGKYNLPDNYLKNNLITDNTTYAYGLNSFWENKKYVYLNLFSANQTFQDILYDKKKEKIRCGYWYDDIGYCSPVIAHAGDDFVVGYHLCEDLFTISHFPENQNKNTILKKITDEITEDDNPVVFFYYFKKEQGND
jgi:hypothetical protein